MFYQQLLREQIPKVQKKTDNLTGFFTFGICARQKLLEEH